MPSATAKSLAPSPGGLTAFRWAELTLEQRNSLLAAGLSWLFSGYAMMLYSALLPQLMPALGMSKSKAGFLNALMLLGTGLGSFLFGTFADRHGRKRALIYSILTFTSFTFLSGLVPGVLALAICRFVVGLGMGGEWTCGTALVAESWPADRRARAVGIVQSGYAVGYALAVFAVGALSPLLTWRGVFFLGLLPALFILWLRKNVNEPAIWKAQAEQAAASRSERKKLWSEAWPRLLALLGMNTFGLFAWWGLFSWVPAYLALPIEQGGRNFHSLNTVTFIVLLSLAGMVPGYLCFGGFADRFGRKKSVVLYLAAAALCVPLFAAARQPPVILVFGCVAAFFGSGFFVGSGTLASELFPTRIRAVALGVSYNVGRSLSAMAPWLIGHFGETHGLGWAFSACAVAYGCAALSALAIPETGGRDLQ